MTKLLTSAWLPLQNLLKAMFCLKRKGNKNPYSIDIILYRSAFIIPLL